MKRKRWLIPVLLFVMAVCFIIQPAQAAHYEWGGKPLSLYGYLTQGASYNLSSNTYYNEEGFNSALTSLLLEGFYEPRDDLKIYVAAGLVGDWMYELKDSDNSWNDKLFDKSDRRQVDDEYWQILKEIHITWTPGDWFFRVGKQIVIWGEMDGFRIMDVMTPVDGSRGPADVEFETSKIPIWLLRSEYTLPGTDFSMEFVFNPNADFIPNKDLGPGTDKFGIWAPEIYIPMGGPAPFDYMYMGSMITNLDEPDEWDSEGFEYGLRLVGMARGWYLSLNGFYGRENTPVTTMAGMPVMGMAYDGRMIMHPVMRGKYPRQKLVGITANKDFYWLYINYLGGAAPVLRFEALYQFDKVFTNAMGAWEEFDQFVMGLGFDWAVRFPFIPQTASFKVMPQVYYNRIYDYPGSGPGLSVEKENFAYTLMVSTMYMNTKLKPSLFWWHDHDNHADFLQLKVKYDYTSIWQFTVGANFFDGRQEGKGFQVFDNKDTLFFKIGYKWG